MLRLTDPASFSKHPCLRPSVSLNHSLLFNLFCVSALCLGLLPPTPARALPEADYDVEFISHPGATNTSVIGVDAMGRALSYWTFFETPVVFPIGSEPDDSGYAFWENGEEQAFTIPGLTNFTINRMNINGAMWGSSDEGAFVYQNGMVELLPTSDSDATVARGIDATGKIYGLFADFPPDSKPDSLIQVIIPGPHFDRADGVYGDLNLLLEDGILNGVRQDGALWGDNNEDAFIQIGDNLTTLGHPDFDSTLILGLTDAGEAYGFALSTGEETASTNFFWDSANGFVDLPSDYVLPGTDERPSELNEDGVFWGFSAANTSFIATPVPEPSATLLQAIGLLLPAILRRRSARGLAYPHLPI